jgi:lipoate-protein ligase A
MAGTGAESGERWRLLDYSAGDAYLNMAVEEAVMRAAGSRQAPPTLRLWQNENAVIIGRFQDAAEEAHLETCRDLGTAVVRRITGGGAVYHDGGNLNYALMIPLDDPRVDADILASYQYFCQGLIEALATLGLQAAYAPINDIVVGTRKVSGTAQARGRGAVLHHGTLLLHLDVERMAQVLNVKQDYLRSKGVDDVRQRVATLEQLGRPTTAQEARHALAEGFARVLRVDLVPGGLTEGEQRLAEELLETRYSRDAWNLSKPGRAAKGHLGGDQQALDPTEDD